MKAPGLVNIKSYFCRWARGGGLSLGCPRSSVSASGLRRQCVTALRPWVRSLSLNAALGTHTRLRHRRGRLMDNTLLSHTSVSYTRKGGHRGVFERGLRQPGGVKYRPLSQSSGCDGGRCVWGGGGAGSGWRKGDWSLGSLRPPPVTRDHGCGDSCNGSRVRRLRSAGWVSSPARRYPPRLPLCNVEDVS